jgi:hypothetical protein
VKLHRAITISPIYTKPPLYLRVFERLILEANWRCERIPFGKGTLLVKRGEKVTSIRQIADWVAWYDRGVLRTPNPKTIHEIMDWLIQEHMIEMVNRSNAQVTHYNVLNYCEYQAVELPEVTVTGEQTQQQLDTNNNINKENKGNKPSGNDSPVGESHSANIVEVDAFFESVWGLYPLKLGKGAVKKAQRERLYKIGLDEISRCIERYKESKEDWRKWKDGSTFFNSGYVDYLDVNYRGAQQQEQDNHLPDMQDIDYENQG